MIIFLFYQHEKEWKANDQGISNIYNMYDGQISYKTVISLVVNVEELPILEKECKILIKIGKYCKHYY